MHHDLQDLTLSWKMARQRSLPQTPSIEKILPVAQARKRNSLYFHYGNIIILLALVGLLCIFFYYFFPFREILSKTGVALMIGSLVIRIVIEIFSSVKSYRIHLNDDVWNVTGQTLDFYLFRKKIHGPVTVFLVALYTMGFYFLTPEFSKYLPLWLMILIDTSYVVGAIIIITQIRKGIKNELRQLIAINDLREKISHED